MQEQTPISFKWLFNLSVIFLMLLPGVLLSTWAVLYSQNSLYLNNDWIVQKRLLTMTVMGADDFLLSRIPLAQNKLNLGSYYGFQEVFTRKELNLHKVDLRFKIENNSYLDLLYNQQGSELQGLRLSRLATSPATSFTANSQGAFIESHPQQLALLDSGWHTAELKNENQKISLILDGKNFILDKTLTLGKGFVGLRSGLYGAQIDHISMTSDDGQKISESFVNTKNWNSLAFINLAGLFFIGLIFSILTLRSISFTNKKVLLPWFLYSLLIIFCFGSWDLFDYFYYSLRVPTDNGITHALIPQNDNATLSAEALRFRLFNQWYALTGEPKISFEGIQAEGYPHDRIARGPFYCGINGSSQCQATQEKEIFSQSHQQNRLYRIIFIGTSQTAGAGATTLQETFFAKSYQWLRKKIPADIALEQINISASGVESSVLLQDYQAHYLNLNPDLVVINLATNDAFMSDVFEKNMRAFLDLNKAASIKTLLIQEPNCSERLDPLPIRNYDVLQALAKEYRVSLIPMNSYFQELNSHNSGHLWWDIVHLTNYGQEAFAQRLNPVILQDLQSDSPQKKQVLTISTSTAEPTKAL